MKLKFKRLTEDELDIQAFERDVIVADYQARVENNQLTPSEKKGRDDLYNSIGINTNKEN